MICCRSSSRTLGFPLRAVVQLRVHPCPALAPAHPMYLHYAHFPLRTPGPLPCRTGVLGSPNAAPTAWVLGLPLHAPCAPRRSWCSALGVSTPCWSRWYRRVGRGVPPVVGCRKRHIPPHPAQPRHANDWAPRTRKRHQQEHRPQRPTERSDPTQHAKGRPGDCPGPREETTTRRSVTRGAGGGK